MRSKASVASCQYGDPKIGYRSSYHIILGLARFARLPPFATKSFFLVRGSDSQSRRVITFQVPFKLYKQLLCSANILATMSLTNCRFYEEKYPEIDSFVMVNVGASAPLVLATLANVKKGQASMFALMRQTPAKCLYLARLQRWAPTLSSSSMTTLTA